MLGSLLDFFVFDSSQAANGSGPSDFALERFQAIHPMQIMIIVAKRFVEGLEYVSPPTGSCPYMSENMLVNININPNTKMKKYFSNLSNIRNICLTEKRFTLITSTYFGKN